MVVFQKKKKIYIFVMTENTAVTPGNIVQLVSKQRELLAVFTMHCYVANYVVSCIMVLLHCIVR